MSESMPTPTIQVNSTSSTATVRAGIVGGVVSLIGMGIVFAVVWVFRRHHRLRGQVLGLQPSRPSRRISLIPSCLSCADSCPSPITLPTPYSIYDHDQAETVGSKMSPFPVVPVAEDDIRAHPQPSQAATSYLSSRGSRLDLPPSYSSLGVGLPRASVRPPQVARSKTTSSVSQHIRSSSRQERPELRISIPSHFLTAPVVLVDDSETRRFSA